MTPCCRLPSTVLSPVSIFSCGYTARFRKQKILFVRRFIVFNHITLIISLEAMRTIIIMTHFQYGNGNALNILLFQT